MTKLEGSASSTNKSTLYALLGTVSTIVLWQYLQQRRSKQDKATEGATDSTLETTSSPTPSVPPTQLPGAPSCIYCDYNATTPIYPEVFEAMRPFFTAHFGNPSSSHIFGQIAKDAIDKARRAVSELINASSENAVYFLSCGTEADNRCVDIALHNHSLAFPSSTTAEPPVLPIVITSSIEHPAVLCYLRILEFRKKLILKVIGVNSEGFVDLEALEAALSPQVALVTIMHSNNEIGTIQPIRAISKLIKRFNRRHNTASILFHSDAAQSLGKVSVDVQLLGLDMLTVVGHKFGAPKGVAALYVRGGGGKIAMQAMMIGGSQERGMRAGTENVPYLVGLGEACRLASLHTRENGLFLLSLKLVFLKRLFSLLSQQNKQELLRLNGPKRSNTLTSLEEDLKMIRHLSKGSERGGGGGGDDLIVEQLPNTVSISFKGLVGHEIVSSLSEQVAVSTGSACHALPASHDSNVFTPSEVLLAIGVDPLFGIGTIRVSFGRFSSEEEVTRAAELIVQSVLTMWREKGL